jgi:glycosyltransferase
LKVSIITATWNSEATIKFALGSVREQNYLNIEHIIIDGQSSDSTLNLIENYGSKTVKVVSEADNGIYDALNKGLNLASGDIVGFLHSDDVFSNNHVISDLVDAFKNSEIDAVYGDLEYVSYNNPETIIRYWKSKNFAFSELKRGWMPPHPTFFMKADNYHKFGGFNTKYKISSDYDHLLRCFLTKDFNAYYLPSVITKMRLGGLSNRSIKNILLKMFEDFSIMRQHGIFPLTALLGKNLSKLIQFFNH